MLSKKRLKKNLRADATEKIVKSIYWKNRKFMWEISSLLRRVASQKGKLVDLLLRKACISSTNTSVFQI